MKDKTRLKMKFKIVIISVISVFFLSCSNEVKKDATSNETVSTEETKVDKLKTEASRLRAGGSIKNVELNGGKAIIKYISNYDEYKKLNPQSSLTQSELKDYWESNDAIEKALIDGAVRIMKKLDFVNEVNITLPYEKNIYEISITKANLEKFIGSDFEKIIKNWDKLFSNPYVYNKKGRQEFFNKFGTKNNYSQKIN